MRRQIPLYEVRVAGVASGFWEGGARSGAGPVFIAGRLAHQAWQRVPRGAFRDLYPPGRSAPRKDVARVDYSRPPAAAIIAAILS